MLDQEFSLVNFMFKALDLRFSLNYSFVPIPRLFSIRAITVSVSLLCKFCDLGLVLYLVTDLLLKSLPVLVVKGLVSL